jgi:hypothetical protein
MMVYLHRLFGEKTLMPDLPAIYPNQPIKKTPVIMMMAPVSLSVIFSSLNQSAPYSTPNKRLVRFSDIM